MQTNVPIDMISFCNTMGDMKPMRLRIENESHERVTADIIEILYKKESKPAGVLILTYGCRIQLYGQEHLVELHYNVASHKWTLYRIVN